MNKKIIGMLACTAFVWMSSPAWAQTALKEAQRHMDRGQAAVEMAKTDADFEEAILEFDQAARLAPTWPDAYYNLGIVQEKIGRFDAALQNLRKYLELSPVATDAGEVRQLINKTEYRKEKSEGVKKVYEIMASRLYTVDSSPGVSSCKRTGGDESGNLYGSTPGSILFREFRMESGRMQSLNYYYRYERDGNAHTGLRPPLKEWEPVEVNGNSYRYKYPIYVDVASGYVVLLDSVIDGEILSINPPRVKEKITTSISSGVPIPGDRNSKGRPFSGQSTITSECVFGWKLK